MRIKVHPSFIIYLICIAIVSSAADCLSMLMALLIHEVCHYTAAAIVGERISVLELTPFGGVMRYERGIASHKGLKGILVHCAGPAGNWVSLMAVEIPFLQQMIDSSIMRSFLLSNTAMLMLNILPVLPLDGGHAAFCLGYYFFPVSCLVSCLSILGMAVGFSGLLCAIYGLLIFQLLNCSLLIISLYLIVYAKKSPEILLAENLYTVLHERMEQTEVYRKMAHYQVAPDTPLLNLVGLLKQNTAVSFFFISDRKTLELTEYMFCHALLTTPDSTVSEAYALNTE